MVLKGCERCGGDMWSELNRPRLEDLFCIQCARRQALAAPPARTRTKSRSMRDSLQAEDVTGRGLDPTTSTYAGKMTRPMIPVR